MTDTRRLSFGIKTVPMHTTYEKILKVWQEADSIPEFEHAWLWDHMLPLGGDPAGPIYEGPTLLAALAAQTERLRLGLMVTSNAVRPPAVLAKIAATTDVISGGRLEFGIGVGYTRTRDPEAAMAPLVQRATQEFEAYGLHMPTPGEGIARLEEALTIFKRMWTADAPFDFEGRYYQLKGAICEPKPVQRPHPPILVGAMGNKTLRVVAEHADAWNIPGPPHLSVESIAERSRVLDAHCEAIGRDPREITRSTQIIVPTDDPEQGRATIRQLVDAGFTHIVLGVFPPGPDHVARWLAEEIIVPVTAEAPAV